MFVDMAHQVEIGLHCRGDEGAERRESIEPHCNVSGRVRPGAQLYRLCPATGPVDQAAQFD
jgi:hypothetical protein